MHLLVIEDESKIRDFLVSGLRAEGHTAEGCKDFDSALTALTINPSGTNFDLVILDRMLDNRDGKDLIPVIRGRYPNCVVLVLSAIGSADEKADILDQGADDYLTKPFSLVELSARIRALGRRANTAPATKFTYANCEIDLVQHSIKVEGKKVELSQKEYQLLVVFLKQPGRVYNRFQLLDQVWNTQFDIESNVVEVTINNLRRKLEKAGSTLQLLSKRNIGYWVEA